MLRWGSGFTSQQAGTTRRRSIRSHQLTILAPFADTIPGHAVRDYGVYLSDCVGNRSYCRGKN